MLGAIVGDVVGSRFEWRNKKSKEFRLFTDRSHPTDDSVMTLAVADALMSGTTDPKLLSELTVMSMQTIGRKYPRAGYGGNFARWLMRKDPKPYRSYGNGSAMRVSPCAHVAKSLEEAKALSKIVTDVSHNHPEGVKGAEATTVATFMALHGSNMEEIRKVIEDEYYKLDFTLDEIRPTYEFDVTCQGSVPQAIEAFLESNSFEDAIRNAISIGGDSDTIGAITGAIAGAYYGIPDDIADAAYQALPTPLQSILNEFESKYCKK